MYIAIEGVIGVGKTTLARLLQPAFHSSLLLEVFTSEGVGTQLLKAEQLQAEESRAKEVTP